MTGCGRFSIEGSEIGDWRQDQIIVVLFAAQMDLGFGEHLERFADLRVAVGLTLGAGASAILLQFFGDLID